MAKPKPALSRSGKPLAGEPVPDALPVLMEPVPLGGRPLTFWEYEELVDWGVLGVRPYWRVAPIPDQPGRFSLWRMPMPRVLAKLRSGVREEPIGMGTRRVGIDLTYQSPAAARATGTLVFPELPADPNHEDPPQ